MLYIYSLSNQAMCTWAHKNNTYIVADRNNKFTCML